MDAERLEKIKVLFDAALELNTAERVEFLEKACSTDGTLREDVQRLLEVHDPSETSLGEFTAPDLIAGSSPKLSAGQTIGHYDIIRQIGIGGMGEVYLAKDNKLDRSVAVKILNDEFSQHSSNLDRFTREAKSASALNHPNILVIHEIGVSGEINYIVSEFIEGRTLREIIGDSPMKTSTILDISIQIVDALAAAHSAKLIHRDIKPENIILRPDGYVKVLDFGLAKLIEQDKKAGFGFEDATRNQHQTAKGVIMGTVNYMSPEQAKGEMVDERTDIFSVGVLVYEMIAGRAPFEADSVSETLANLIKVEPPPLSRYAANVQNEMQRIVSKALRKNKDERYQTMKGLLADLKDLRRNLEFDERLERSVSSSGEDTVIIPASTTGDTIVHTARTDQNFTGQIRQNRPFLILAAAVLLIVVAGLGYYLLVPRKAALNADGKRSLAVLPFVNAGQDPNAEYLSDGLTESVINNLSQLTGLRVMSRNSAFRFKNDQSDAKKIAAQLGVETLVTGDIKQLGDRLIINVRLINASDDSQIWGSQYVKTTVDIIATQNEIAQAIAQNLRLKLTNTDTQMLAKHYTENAEAYQLYSLGRFHVFKLTPPDVQQAISYFQQAIDRDPNYALAYAGISDAYRSLALGSEMNPTENLSKSKAAALKAIELDDNLSEGHAALGVCFFWGEWDWARAEDQYKRALELNPNDVNAHTFYAHVLSNTGRHTEALAEISRARELDPLFPFAGALEGQFLLHAGKTEEALVRLQKTFELAPNFWMPHLFASSVYTEKKMYPEAIAEARKARELSAAQTVSMGFEGYALAKMGRIAEARALIDGLLKLSKEQDVPSDHIAFIYNGLGENDKALEWLERAYKEHDPKMAFLKVEPKWNNLRSEPRFIELMKRMNLS